MQETSQPVVRGFGGDLADAEGLLTVERATFDETPYSAAEIQEMLGSGRQHAWLACASSEVVGFVVAFPTCGLWGPSWEIDLLAVLPAWRGRGLATALISAAAAYGGHVARRARAVVATDNRASGRAFGHSGFRASPGQCNLLIYRTDQEFSRFVPVPGVRVRPASSSPEAVHWLDALGTPHQGNGTPSPAILSALDGLDGHRAVPDQGRLSLLLAEKDGQPAGFAELVEVETLLYKGVWIESLAAPFSPVRTVMIQHIMRWARESGLDEVGTMVPEQDWALQHGLLAAGFRSLGEFRWFTAELPVRGDTVA